MKLLSFFTILFLVSCGATKKVTEIKPRPEVNALRYKKVEANYSKNTFAKSKFETLKISAKANTIIGGKANKFGLNIRIAKKQKIWISADFLGFPVAKILLEPESVKYYNKINNTYFEGGYDMLSDFLGYSPLNYQTVENLLVGDIIFDKFRGFNVDVINDLHVATNTAGRYVKTVKIDADIFKLIHQKVKHRSKKNLFEASYTSFKAVNGYMFPQKVRWNSTTGKKDFLLSMFNKSIKFDEKLNFPYKVPKECTKRIEFKPRLQ